MFFVALYLFFCLFVFCFSNKVYVAKVLFIYLFICKLTFAVADLCTICKHLRNPFLSSMFSMHLHLCLECHQQHERALSSFFSSFLSNVFTPFQITVLHERKRNLLILVYMKAITAGLDMGYFVRVFAQRRMIL